MPKMIAARFCRNPDFPRGRMAIDDYSGAIFKRDVKHTITLMFNIAVQFAGINCIGDGIKGCLRELVKLGFIHCRVTIKAAPGYLPCFA